MSHEVNVRSVVLDSVELFEASYPEGRLTASFGKDVVFVDCHLSGRRLIVATGTAAHPGVDVAILNMETGGALESKSFSAESLTVKDVLNLMEGRFDKGVSVEVKC